MPNSTYQKVLIVAHDAGGAEIISSWVKANPNYNFFYLLEGPAIAIFLRKLGEIENQSTQSLPILLEQVDFVLTGTSWASALERSVIEISKSSDVFVISYLDHWTNYLERFFHKESVVLPDEIWVADEHAKKIALQTFKDISIKLIHNPYLIEMQEAYQKLIQKDKHAALLNLLYICEPISTVSYWKTGCRERMQFTEFSAMEYFFECVQNFRLPKPVHTIKIRLHPSEKKNKYDPWIEYGLKQNLPLVLSEATTLLEDLAWADWVIGMSSMALAIAAQLNKTVLTCTPPGAQPCLLPLSNIHTFKESTISFLDGS